jgi:hypothetical protein
MSNTTNTTITTNATPTSGLYSINWKDFLKGLLVAALTTPLTTLYTSLQAGSFNVDWKALGLVAAAGGLSYVLKNFFTPSQLVSKNPAAK